MNDTTAPLRTLTVKETANILDVSVETVYKWIKEGNFPPAFKIGRVIRVSVPALTEFLRNPPNA